MNSEKAAEKAREQPPPPTPTTPKLPSSSQLPPNKSTSTPTPNATTLPPTTPKPPPSTTGSALGAIPSPLKTLFDRFPLRSYPPNRLPARSPRERERRIHTLYVFGGTPSTADRTGEIASSGTATGGSGTGEGGSSSDNQSTGPITSTTTTTTTTTTDASFNPTCLKWQTYLKFCKIKFRTVPSSNHASPSGALPFLIPGVAPAAGLGLGGGGGGFDSGDGGGEAVAVKPVIASKLQKWALEHYKSPVDDPADIRYEAYLALIDHAIRRAWLYSLYLTSNARTVAEPLYISPTSSNSIVCSSISHDLRLAAEQELVKHSPVIDAERLYHEGEEALDALDALLGDDTWFFDGRYPSLFDASVFAYTHLLLEDGLGRGWSDRRLCEAVRERERLVEHRDRILLAYF